MKFGTSPVALKDVRLTRQLAYLSLAASLFYIIFDTANKAFSYLPIYFILVSGATLALYLLKKKRINFAKGVLLVAGNLIITSFGSVESLETGIYFFYVMLAIAALSLFGYKDRAAAFIFVLISILLFCFVFLTDIQLVPHVDLSESYIKASMLVNFILIMTTSILIVFYLLQNNYLAETALKKQKEHLIRTTHELEISQRRFELAIQGSSAAIWDWDIRNNVLFITPKLAEILKRPLDQIQGVSREKFFEIVHPQDALFLERMLDRHLEKKEHFEMECRVRTGPGEYVWILDSGQAEWDSDGKPVRMVGTFVDIHEKKLAVEQVKAQNAMLAKTNEELDRFVYSTSHDLRAPLSSLLGLLNLADTSEAKDERKSIIQMMRGQIIKLDSYIQDITDYSRNARVDVDKEEFLISEVIFDIFDQLKFMEGAENVELFNDVDTLATITTDKSRFKIILNNLISNAIKYRDPRKRSFLKISMLTRGDSYMLKFEDNGIGIEKAHLEKVFDMFYRASDRSRGSGLGLYISKEIAEKIGFQIDIESTFGQGTTFTVHIPREA